MFFWEDTNPPFTTKRSPHIRNSLIKEELSKCNHWILGGSIINWGEDVFPKFNLAVFLWVPPEIRIARLRKREFERYGNIIYSDPNRKKLFEDFLSWAVDYDKHTGLANRTLLAHEEWLRKIMCPVLEIRGDLTTEERINIIIEKLSSTTPEKH